MPQVVKVSWFVARLVREGQRFLGGDFLQRIGAQHPILGKVREFLIAAQHRAFLERIDELFAQGDVHFHIVAFGQGPLVAQIEREAVLVLLAVFPIEGEYNARGLAHGCIHRLQLPLEFIECHTRGQSKVEILRKAVIAEIASLQRRSALESESRLEVRFRKRRQEPGEAVVAFKHVVGNAASAFLDKPVGEKRDIALGDHSARPDRFEFLARDVKLKPPAAQVRPLFGQHGIERNIGLAQHIP